MRATPPRSNRRFATALPALAPSLAWALLGLCQGCAPAVRGDAAFTVREVTPAFLRGFEARDPALAADGRGTVVLAWVTGDSSSADVWLSVSRDSGATFTAPSRVNVKARRVVARPGSGPAVAIGAGGTLAVAWSEMREDTSGAVDLRVRASADFGRTLGGVATINDDCGGPPPGLRWRQLRDWPLSHRPNAIHGLPALAFTNEGLLLAAWLDDRRVGGPAGARVATVWRSVSRDGGQGWSPNEALSDSASPRCRPALAVASDGAVALGYREAANDLRDPRLALSDDGRAFATDTLIARDGWRLAACPGEPVALAWEGSRGGYAAWFTGAAPAGVYVARWRRGGGVAGLKRPVAEDLHAAAHPMMAVLGESVLIGVESRVASGTSRRRLAVRALDRAGNWSAWTPLGADASSGELVASGSLCAVTCWIEHDTGHTRLRLAALSLRPGEHT